MKPGNTPRSKFTIVRDAQDPDRVQEIHVVLDTSVTPDQANKFIAHIDGLERYIHKLYVASGDISEELYKRFIRFTGEDYQQLLDAYIDQNKDLLLFVLQQRAQKAMHYYIREVFFDDYSISDIDEAIKHMKDKYTMVSDDTLDICKRKSFNQICMLSLLDELDQELPETTRRVIQDVEQGAPTKDGDEGKVILHGVVQTTLIAACNEQFLIERFAKHWQDAARSICKEDQKNALESYAKKHFFATHKDMYYGWNTSLTAEMDQHVQRMLPHFPLLNSSVKHRYKSKHFYTEAQQQYIKYCLHYIDQAIKQDAYLLEDNDIYKELDKKLFDIDTYIYFLKKKIDHMYADFCAERQKRIDEEKKRNLPKQAVQQAPQISVRQTESNKLTPLQEQKLQELEQKMLHRVKIDIQYITRMLKKWWPIYVESLVEDMGQWYSQELLEELIGILQQFDVEIVTKKDKEIESMASSAVWNIQSVSNNSMSESLLSWWIDMLQATPWKLTWSLFLFVLEELWYKFLSKKDFLKQAEQMLWNRERKKPLIIQKKIVDGLRIGDSSWETRISCKRWPLYQVFGNKLDSIRLVKQWKTILLLAQHEEYKQYIDATFVSQKKDYSDPKYRDNTPTEGLLSANKYNTQRTNEFTAEDADKLSEGA